MKLLTQLHCCYQRIMQTGFVNEAEILCSKMRPGNSVPNQVTYGCFLDILTKGEEEDMQKAVDLPNAILNFS